MSASLNRARSGATSEAGSSDREAAHTLRRLARPRRIEIGPERDVAAGADAHGRLHGARHERVMTRRGAWQRGVTADRHFSCGKLGLSRGAGLARRAHAVRPRSGPLRRRRSGRRQWRRRRSGSGCARHDDECRRSEQVETKPESGAM
jgi:hypothetical protein